MSDREPDHPGNPDDPTPPAAPAACEAPPAKRGRGRPRLEPIPKIPLPWKVNKANQAPPRTPKGGRG